MFFKSKKSQLKVRELESLAQEICAKHKTNLNNIRSMYRIQRHYRGYPDCPTSIAYFEIIETAFNSWFSCNIIGYVLKKNHTTIMHHLKALKSKELQK